MEVVICQENERPQWEEYVLRCPQATLGHDYRWRGVIERAYGHGSIYLMARSRNGIRGILPLILVRSPFTGSSLSSMPFLDYGGVCADEEKAQSALIDRLHAIKAQHAVSWVEFRHGTELKVLGEPKRDKVSMLLDITGGEEQLWKALPAKVRNQVRKAEKSGLVIQRGGHELLEDFYKVFAINMRDLGSPVHSLAFFTSMATEFSKRLGVALVKDGTRTVGGLVSLIFKDTISVPWASCLREYFAKCPNNLLYWDVIRTSCHAGYKTFDFGRSTIRSGTYEFKRQWGAFPHELSWQYLPLGEPADGRFVTDASLKYQVCSQIWRQLPVVLTVKLGPYIRKYLTN